MCISRLAHAVVCGGIRAQARNVYGSTFDEADYAIMWRNAVVLWRAEMTRARDATEMPRVTYIALKLKLICINVSG